MLACLQKVINKWDPLSLFPFAPADEYKNEIEQIESRLKDCHSVEDVCHQVVSVFEAAFGSAFPFSLAECERVAKEIWENCRS